MLFSLKSVDKFARAMRAKNLSDALILKTLNDIVADDLEILHDKVQGRIDVARKLRTYAEHGYIAVIESGMDCDCVAYSGHVHLFSAAPERFWREVDNMYYNAEGPITWYLERPSVATSVESTQRDLALEAFENEHPYSIRY